MNLIEKLKSLYSQDELDMIDTQASLLIANKKKEIDNIRRNKGILNKEQYELEVYPVHPNIYSKD